MGLPFQAMRSRIKRIQNDFVVEIVKSIVADNSNEIIDLNTREQLYKRGVDSSGKSLGQYSNPYKKLKKALNQPSDRVTLRLEGDFYESFEVLIQDQQFKIIARDKKTQWLIKRYGYKILGLTSDNVSLFREIVIKPDLLKEIRKEINK